MRTADHVVCEGRCCEDVLCQEGRVPCVDVAAEHIRIVLVSEAAPQSPADDYYGPPDALFARTTLQAFGEAGLQADAIDDLLALGIYMTSAVKCPKLAYGLKAATVTRCSRLLERELALFPNLRALLLMGDVAIQSLNAIARRVEGKRVIPAGSTYKLRGSQYSYRGVRVFPSYLQAGPAYFIESQKRTMIAQDLAGALALLA